MADMVDLSDTLVQTSEAAMPDKYPSQESYRRVNIYLKDGDEELFELAAEWLESQGERGMFNGEGEVNKTAVVRRLLKQAAEKAPRK